MDQPDSNDGAQAAPEAQRLGLRKVAPLDDGTDTPDRTTIEYVVLSSCVLWSDQIVSSPFTVWAPSPRGHGSTRRAARREPRAETALSTGWRTATCCPRPCPRPAYIPTTGTRTTSRTLPSRPCWAMPTISSVCSPSRAEARRGQSFSWHLALEGSSWPR